jgi:secondary thiamine-phosphate synthase enzyme
MPMQTIRVNTHDQMGFVDLTDKISDEVRRSGVQDGMVYLFVPHTTCGITIQENADPGVQHDMQMLLNEIAPRQDRRYRHIEDNSASHLQASAMGFSCFVFIQQGRLVLGRWQAIYLTEFDGPRVRTVHLKVVAH